MLVSGQLVKAFGPLSALGLECLIGGTVLYGVATVRGEARAMRSHSLRYYLVCGGCWIGNFLLFILGVGAATDARELVAVGLINYLWPCLTVMFAVPLLGRRANLLLPIGLFLTVCGVVAGKLAVSDIGLAELSQVITVDPNLLAYALVFVCAIAWAVYSNLSVVYATPGLPGGVPLFMLTAAPLLLIVGAAVGERPRHGGGTALLADVAMVAGWAICSGLASLTWDVGARHGRVVLFGSLSMLIPFFSTVLTAWHAGMGIRPLVLMGGALVVFGSWCARRGVEETGTAAPVVGPEAAGQ